MNRGTRMAMAAGIAGVIALAATAVAQTPPPRQPQEGKPRTDGRGRPRQLCGPGRPAGLHRGLPRVVHSETKVQMAEGFGFVIVDNGEITAVSGSRVTLRRADGESVTVGAGDDTRVCRNHQPAQVADLRAGDRSHVLRMRSGDETVVRGIRAFSPDFRPEPPPGRTRDGARSDGKIRPTAPQRSPTPSRSPAGS